MYLLLVVGGRILQVDKSFGWRSVLSFRSWDVIAVQDVINGDTLAFMSGSGPSVYDFAHDFLKLVLEGLSLPGYVAIPDFAPTSFVSIYVF